ncbi:MAG: dipicolinate synthase subunit B [Ruminococcaceae bacterium]|nr:dipicolinate synthase subunit B [Oscillospiraceae bacterium]
MLGYAFCGSFCTHQRSLEELQKLIDAGYDVLPIFSDSVWTTDTRFGTALALKERVESICHKSVIHTVVDAEPIGPKTRLDALIVCPCTGNTLAKIANGITDTPVCMAVKAHLRSDRPLILSLASNDALSANLKNIATLLSRKQVYFVPMVQDDPEKKPHSLVADFSLLQATLDAALQGRQYRRLFL